MMPFVRGFSRPEVLGGPINGEGFYTRELNKRIEKGLRRAIETQYALRLHQNVFHYIWRGFLSGGAYARIYFSCLQVDGFKTGGGGGYKWGSSVISGSSRYS